MAVLITIDGVDKTKKVAWESLRISNIKTSQVDKCSFKIRSYGDDTYEPRAGAEVIITDNSIKVFAGFIVRVDQSATDYKVLEYKIECVDYTRLLQKKLVIDSYKDLTVTEIITQLINTYCDGYGIDVSNVNCPNVIESISFNYLPIQQCLEQLANITGYDWWIDYDKKLYFVASSTVSAPFGLTDTNGKYQFNSLRIRKDNSQIKNSIIVRGGNYYASTLTVAVECNGTDFTYPTSYKFRDIQVTLSGSVLDVGIDFSSDADNHDVLYNFNEKVLKWKEEDRPSIGATLSVSGEPLLPVIIKQKNPASIDAMLSAENVAGDYEFLITDNKLNSKEEARNRADAELTAYSDTLEEGEFITETSGLKAGQSININSDAHNINENYIIREVQSVMFTPTTMRYKVSLISTRTIDMIGVLQQLLLNQGDTYLSKDEILDKITSYFETITITDTHSESKSHNPQTETVGLSETFSAEIDKEIYFVAGPFIPTGTKRVFIVNGSKVG